MVTHAAVCVSVEELRGQGFGVAAEVPHLLLVLFGGGHVHVLHGDRAAMLELAFQNHLDLLLLLLDLIEGSIILKLLHTFGAFHTLDSSSPTKPETQGFPLIQATPL